MLFIRSTISTMCTKTKTSFGCGHCVKMTEYCGIPNCQTMERWKFPKFMDCGKCRASGQEVTRGRDGRGQHGREIARHKESRRSSADPITPPVDSPGTPHLTISPWARKTPEIPQEKTWNTPTRQKADEAWLVEHERRLSDLEEKTSKMSLQSSRRGSRRSSPRQSHERVIHVIEVEEPEEIDELPSRTKTIPMLPYEIEEASKTYSHHRGRKASRDSEGSMPHYQESPMIKTPRRKTHHVPPISEHDSHEHYETPRKHRHHGSRTEPYYPQSCFFESPMSGSPVVTGEWPQHYQFVQPLQRDPYHPRTYQVY